MRTLDMLSKKQDARVAGIDVSSKKIAVAIVSRKDEEWFLHGVAAIELPDDMRDKIGVMNVTIPKLFKDYNVQHVVIEQSIYIQNPKTSRLLSYIIGALFSICLRENYTVSDVLPMVWKNFIGYQRIMKPEKDGYIAKMGKTEAKKFMNKERKERTKRILEKRIDCVKDIKDDDIVDAIGISMWGLQNIK